MSLLETYSFSLTNIENNSLKITLTASGGIGIYTFKILTNPSNGVLSDINKDQVIYYPNNNYVGYDSFIYNCTDGITASQESVITINIGAQVSTTSNNIINANIFETVVITLNPLNSSSTESYTFTILDQSIGIITNNNLLLKKTGKTKLLYSQNNTNIYINLNVYYYNKNQINNLISPILSYQRNMNKFYKEVISNNNKILNANFKNYTTKYFDTTYDRILYPNVSNVPY
jgi:hypothetical protein